MGACGACGVGGAYVCVFSVCMHACACVCVCVCVCVRVRVCVGCSRSRGNGVIQSRCVCTAGGTACGCSWVTGTEVASPLSGPHGTTKAPLWGPDVLGFSMGIVEATLPQPPPPHTHAHTHTHTHTHAHSRGGTPGSCTARTSAPLAKLSGGVWRAVVSVEGNVEGNGECGGQCGVWREV